MTWLARSETSHRRPAPPLPAPGRTRIRRHTSSPRELTEPHSRGEASGHGHAARTASPAPGSCGLGSPSGQASCCPSNFFLRLLSLPVPGGSHVLQGGGRLASPDFHGPSAAECRGEGGADRPRLCPPAPAPRAPAAPRVLCCTPDAGPALAARSPDTCPVCSGPCLSFTNRVCPAPTPSPWTETTSSR